MTSKAAALLGDLGVKKSYDELIKDSQYDFLTVVQEYRRITYGGDCCVSDDVEYLSEGSVDGDATHFRIGDTGMGIFLMVPRSGASLCLMDTRVPGGKGS